ncbi:MAG: recombinase family protein [Thermincolia bacterium]
MNAIGYVRVSTEEQGQEERFSLPHQKDHIAQECKARGWQLLNTFEDTESGKSTRKRKGFKSALEAMKDADILIVHELDRLSRNMIDTLIIVDDLTKSRKKFVSIHDNIDSSNEQGELQLHILAVFAHYFRKQLGRKVYGSMLTRAEQGLYNTKPPIGYKLENGHLVVDPSESWIVEKIFALYSKNKGLRAIAEELNSLGIKTKTGALWNTFPIRNILKNQVYIGNSIWNKTKRVDTKEIKNSEEKWVVVENTHKPIIDKDLFNLVQDRLKTKGNIGGRAHSSPYLLSGLLRCGHCGNAMIGNKTTGRTKKSGKTAVYIKYVCSGYHKQGICHFVFVHKEELEAKVIDGIKARIGTREEAKATLKIPKQNTVSLREQRKKLLNELEQIKTKFKRQLEAYEAGVLSLPDLAEAKQRVTDQEISIKKELSNINTQLESVNDDDFIKRQLSDFYTEFIGKPIPEQKAWLQKNISQVIFTDMDNIKIRWSL